MRRTNKTALWTKILVINQKGLVIDEYKLDERESHIRNFTRQPRRNIPLILGNPIENSLIRNSDLSTDDNVSQLDFDHNEEPNFPHLNTTFEEILNQFDQENINSLLFFPENAFQFDLN